MNNIIYFDNAATTPIRPDVYEAMKPYMLQAFIRSQGKAKLP